MKHKELQKYLGVYETLRRKNHEVILSPSKKKAIMLYLQGYTPAEISQHVGLSLATIYKTLNSEYAQEVMKSYGAHLDRELSSLTQLAIDVVRDTLRFAEGELRYKAAKDFLKGVGRYSTHLKEERETAEDVVRRLIEYQDSEQKLTIKEERRGKHAIG